MLKDTPKAYGGDLLRKRKARLSGRPLTIRQTMHFVLRSTQANGKWSFFLHKIKIRSILEAFGQKYGVKLISMANVGNHLHLHIQLTHRQTYPAFIRAVTASIMIAVTGISRWNKIKLKKKFWDRRPFSRVITSYNQVLRMKDYILINRLEGHSYSRDQARFMVEWKDKFRLPVLS